MLRLSLDALLIVDAIDRRGSFSAAGKELHRVPSTISYTVGKLEDDLGVQVFERNGPRVVLTRAGRELLKEGRYLLKAAQDLEHRVRRVASGWETELTLGLDSMFSPLVFADDIAAFYQVAQQTRLRIAQETLSGTWEALLERRVDLLLGAPGDGPPAAATSPSRWARCPLSSPWRLRIRWPPSMARSSGGTCSNTAPSSSPIRPGNWRRAPSACCWDRTR